MTTTVFRIVDSPIGPLTLAGSAGVLTRLRMDGEPPPGATAGPGAFGDVVEQLDAYFAGRLTTFDVSFELEGTPFQRSVWAALMAIPYGETRSYRQQAISIGRPTAFRAVGLANGANPVGIIVPCHRVIGSSGALVGYGGGLDRKRALLELERSHNQPRLAGGA